MGAQVNEAAAFVVGVDVEDVEMVKSTGMVCGVLVAPVPMTVMVVEYVPAASPATIAVAVNEPGAVPERDESKSHPAGVLTLQSNAPVPELEMVTVCAAGLLPPSMAEMARAVGLRLIVAVELVVDVDVVEGVGDIADLNRPYACPFPGFARAVASPEFPPSAHPASTGRKRTINPRPIDLKKTE